MDARGRAHSDDAAPGPADRYLRGFAASLPGAVVLVDEDVTVWSANPAAADLLGRPAEQLVGRPVLDLFGPAAGAGERGAEPLAAAVERAARLEPGTDGGPGAGPSATFTTTTSAPGAGATPLRVAVGHITMEDRHFATLVLGQDLDDGEARDRFTGQGADAPIPLWITGPDAATTWYNAAWSELTGHPARLRLEEWAALVHPADRAATVSAYRRAVAAGAPFELRYRLRGASGAYLHVLDRGAPHDGDGRGETGWVGSTVDVTELVEAQDAVAVRERRQSAVSVLGRMALGPAPIEEVRQAAIDVLRGELDADAVGYFTATGTTPGTVRLVASRGWRAELVDATFPATQLFWAHLPTGRLTEGVLVADWSHEAELVPSTFVTQYGYRTSMAVALPPPGTSRPDVVSVQRAGAGFSLDDLEHLRHVTQVLAAATAERMATTALLDRETMLTLSMEAGNMGHWVWDGSTEEARFSAGLEAMCGVGPGGLGSRWESFSGFIVPADRARVHDELFRDDPDRTDVGSELRIRRPEGGERWLEVRGRAVPGTGSPSRRWVGVGIDVTERKAAEREARVMAGLSDLFASRLGFDTMMQRVVRAVVPHLADTCSIHLVGDAPTRRRWWLADADPELEHQIARMQEERAFDPEVLLPDLSDPGPHRPRLLEEVTEADRLRAARDARELELFGVHGGTSAIIAPLEARGRALGLLTLTSRAASGRRYRESDLGTAEDLARRVANAVDNARLERDNRRARDRLDVLARIGTILTVSLDSEARLEAVAQAVVPSFADGCIIYSGIEDGALVPTHVAAADPDLARELSTAGSPPLAVDSDALSAEALRTGRPILRERSGEIRMLHDEPLARMLTAKGLHSALAVPMPTAGEPGETPTVMIFVLLDASRRFGPEDVALGVELARRSGPAVSHAVSFQREQRTAEVLQRNLLPDHLPTAPGVTFSACYLPGFEGLSVGGDWYDAIPLGDGRVLIAIGDVVGLGITAAVSMGRIRTVLHYCALEDSDPASVLHRLNSHLRALPDAEMATLALLLYDPSSEHAVLSSAGHLPPVLRDPDGRVGLLPSASGAPLRASATSRYENHDVDLRAGSTVVLYTDGLVERRGECLDEGFERLTRVVEDLGDDPDDLARRLVDRMIGADVPPDDTAVLTMHVRRLADLELVLPARPDELTLVRSALRHWLRRVGATEQETAEIVLAANEAVGNAVVHAYGLTEGEVLLSARLRPAVARTAAGATPTTGPQPPEGPELEVVVRDSGRWRPPGPPGSNGGRGLRMIRGVMDHVEVDRGDHPGPGGTTVVMRRRLAAGSATP